MDNAAEEFRRLNVVETKIPESESLRKLSENGNGKHHIAEGDEKLLEYHNQG